MTYSRFRLVALVVVAALSVFPALLLAETDAVRLTGQPNRPSGGCR